MISLSLSLSERLLRQNCSQNIGRSTQTITYRVTYFDVRPLQRMDSNANSNDLPWNASTIFQLVMSRHSNPSRVSDDLTPANTMSRINHRLQLAQRSLISGSTLLGRLTNFRKSLYKDIKRAIRTQIVYSFVIVVL